MCTIKDSFPGIDNYAKNTEEVEFSELENQLQNCNLPKIKPDKIYNIGMFDFKSSYAIKTVEQTIPLHNTVA